MRRLSDGRARARMMLIGGALVVLATACAGEEPAADSSSPSTTAAEESTTTSTEAKDDGETTSTTLQAVTVEEGDLDLSSTPSIIVHKLQDPVVYFETLSSDPTVTVDGVDGGEDLTISPDGRHAAVTRPGDAVRPARVEIVTTADGKVVASHEVDATSADARYWAPDSSAVMGGGRSGSGEGSFAAVGIDGSVQALTRERAEPEPLWGRGASQTKVVECESGGCTASLQLMTSKGVPVTLGSNTQSPTGPPVQSGTIDADTGQIVAFEGQLGTSRFSGNACGRFALLSGGRNAEGSNAAWLFDSDTGRLIELSSAFDACPVVSPSGTHVAGRVGDGSVAVIELATGVETEVARDAEPIAWSKDDTELVVAGNGTFVVAADGSGGKEASVQIASYCAVGDGTVIVATDSSSGTQELVRYDIATDSAKTLGRGALEQTCEVSTDGTWLVSGRTMVDLTENVSGKVVVTDGERPLSGVMHFVKPRAVVAVERV